MPYYFKPKLLPTLAFLAIFPVLVYLGYWQLDRAQTKAAWITALQEGKNLSLTQALSDPRSAQFHTITLEGQFLEEPILLLMHQGHQGIQGVQVIQFFQITGEEQPILVNRGFLPKGKQLPLLPGQSPVLYGIIDLPKPDRFILGKNILDEAARPLPVQRLDINELNALFQTHLMPLVILANQDLGDGLIRDWQITPRMPPEKHWGYAVQWFALALCLALIYLFVNLKKRP